MRYCTLCGAKQEAEAKFCTSCGKQPLNHREKEISPATVRTHETNKIVSVDKNKLVLPIAILIASVIVGGFYYASQASKQQSIEKQQQIDLQAKQAELKAKKEADKMKVIQDGAARELCEKEAKETAVYSHKQICDNPLLRDSISCNSAGQYNIEQYKNLLDICFQRKGLK